MTGTLVLLSGGMDSTVLLAQTIARSGGDRVETLSVDYGQRHARELTAAAAIADHYRVPWDVADLASLATLLRSALTGHGDIPEGHYADATMRATVVPNRNAVLLMVAAGYAASRGLSCVATAVHAGDHPVYPDCRPEFIDAASAAATLGTQGIGDVQIVAPFVRMTKAQIAALGYAIDAPLDLTWSCYMGGGYHCGRCGTCVERAEAFAEAAIVDPTTYADPDYWRTATESEQP